MTTRHKESLGQYPGLIDEVFEVFGLTHQVRDRQNPDDWARDNRVYPNTADVPGPREPSLTPYMIPWARSIASGNAKIAVMVCAAQTGKTDSFLDIIGERLDNRPTPIIYVGPS